MRSGLAARILIAGGIVVAFLLVAFGLTVHSFQTVRGETKKEHTSLLAVVAASRVEKLVLDLETGARGYVITSDPLFLQPWHEARTELPVESRLLLRRAPGPASEQINRDWLSYLNDYSLPLVRLVRTDPKAARSLVATGEGKRRVDAIRAVIDPLISRQLTEADVEQGRVSRAERTGVMIGLGGVVLTILLVAAVVGYVLRFAVVPLRRIALATGQVAAGEAGVRVPEHGAAEVGRLVASFNEMSRSLEKQRNSLAEQNDDLERLANVLRAVLDSTVDGILLSDAEGNVQLANRPLVTLTRELGMSYEGPVVERLLSVEHRVADPIAYRAAMERLRDNPTDSTFDEFEDTVSGRVFQGFTAPVFDDRGGFLGRIWTLRDVTQQRELDQLKDEFVATVSHELRTPLTSMMGFLEMIREEEAGSLTDEQKRFLAIVYRSSERLQRLVGDLLFVARLDANGLQLQFADVDLTDVVTDVVESAAPLARTRKIELDSSIEAIPPVSADRERLVQLVGNLVSNAIKFTPEGGRITARSFIEDNHAVIEVEDTGIGIPPAEQGRLFQRFFRSTSATEQAIPGTGLGLVISKAIAEAHGGSISMRSRPGEGTCFRVELPLEPEEVPV